MTEQRSEVRHRSYLGGRLDLDSLSSVDCLVRDLSVRGARLAVRTDWAANKVVTLDIKHLAMKRKAEIVWRSAEACGVRFL